MDYIGGLSAEWQSINFGEIFTASSLLTSLFFVVTLLFVRRMLIRYIWRDTEVLTHEQRGWIIRIKNLSAIILLLGAILIWAPQLHTFALSLAAFAVAVVIATKEMILCLTGAVMRMTSQPFKAGDWVTVEGILGEVVDLDAFSFRLQEVDVKGRSYHFTGRTITIPNSKLFSTNVENSNFFKSYLFEDLRIHVPVADVDPVAASQALRDITEKHFEPYRTEALAFNRKIRRRTGVGIALAEPVFDLSTTDLGNYIFHVRLFLPTTVAATVRADISRDFLGVVHEGKQVKED